MGAFELPLLIIAWFVAICLIAPVILAVLVLIIGAVCSVLIKTTDKYTDSDNLLDKVKAPNPVSEVRINSKAYSNPHRVVQDKYSSLFCFDYKKSLLDAVCTRRIIAYIKSTYGDKYPTVKNFDLLQELYNYVLILKDKDGNVLGKEELDPMVLLKFREAALKEYEQKHDYLTE